MNENFNLFAPLTKIDPEKKEVWGWASVSTVNGKSVTDSQGEQVSLDALKKAVPAFLEFPALRSMHALHTAGVVKSLEVREGGDKEGWYICAKVSDPVDWAKVTDTAYRGFSIGGKRIAKVGDVITEVAVHEISLVDRPSNPACKIEMYKSDMALSSEVAPDGRPFSKSESKEPYGSVTYADPGYQEDGKKRYPIDTEAHVRSAWSYINQDKNGNQYTPAQVKRIKARVVSAWKAKIDKEGPASADTSKATYTETEPCQNCGQDITETHTCKCTKCDKAFGKGHECAAPEAVKAEITHVDPVYKRLVMNVLTEGLIWIDEVYSTSDLSIVKTEFTNALRELSNGGEEMALSEETREVFKVLGIDLAKDADAAVVKGYAAALKTNVMRAAHHVTMAKGMFTSKIRKGDMTCADDMDDCLDTASGHLTKATGHFSTAGNDGPDDGKAIDPNHKTTSAMVAAAMESGDLRKAQDLLDAEMKKVESPYLQKLQSENEDLKKRLDALEESLKKQPGDGGKRPATTQVTKAEDGGGKEGDDKRNENIPKEGTPEYIHYMFKKAQGSPLSVMDGAPDNFRG